MTAFRFDCFGLSERGEDHEFNDDHFALDAAAGLFAVADGMGGRPDGWLASKTAVETALDRLRGQPPDTGHEKRALTGAFKAANSSVWHAGHDAPGAVGMGTTMSVLLTGHGRGHIGHVGDSRIYRFRAGELAQLTTDHSLVAELVRRGHIPPEAAATHPLRGQLTESLGTKKSVEPQIVEIDIAPGDLFLLATDGLPKAIDPELLLDEIGRHRQDASDELCRRLMAKAKERPLRDDLTVAVVKVGATE
jgi:protein phosphatase